jgi:tRNA dimethylallyltransferase
MVDQVDPLLVIVGPTAVGKTRVAIDLGRRLDGEVISADSRQVYRYMDIGTAKPTSKQRSQVPHHLVDILDPSEQLSLAVFQQLAYQAIDDVTKRGKLPFLVGGTGQYVTAIVEGWGIPRVEPQPHLRADLSVYANVYSPTALHHWLSRVDPTAADSIDYRNVRRVIRALEVFLVSGRPISDHQRKSPPPYRILQIGLTRTRDALYKRIDCRVDEMVKAGLVDEVRALVDAGYSWDLPSMAGLGYRQFAPFFAGKSTLAETVSLIKAETHRFVRHQDTWFRRNDETIRWYDLGETGPTEIIEDVQSWLDDQSRDGSRSDGLPTAGSG